METIYLDHAATTRPLAQLTSFYGAYACEGWQNPSALYAPAVDVQKQLEEARKHLLTLFGAQGHKCFFTSCGTESANTVILRGFKQRKNINFVCAMGEHPCVEESFRFLEQSGQEVRYVRPDEWGGMAAERVADAVDENTALVSVMHVSNETGALNDIVGIARAVKQRNPQALFHSDGVQAFGKQRLTGTEQIDFYTVSAHKLGAFKGTGAIFAKPQIKPLLLGGGQEGGVRSGTQNTLGILAFDAAVRHFEKNAFAPEGLKDYFRTCVDAAVEDVIWNAPSNGCEHIVSVSFPGVNGETLLHMLEQDGIYISTGSACSSKKGKGRIATALGWDDVRAAGSVRISFGPSNTREQIPIVTEKIKQAVQTLRRFQRR